MIRWLLTRLLKWGEKQVGGVSMDYAYHLRDVAPSRLLRFSMIKAVRSSVTAENSRERDDSSYSRISARRRSAARSRSER